MNAIELYSSKYKDIFDQAIKALRQTAGLDLEVIEYTPTTIHAHANTPIKIMYDNKIYDFGNLETAKLIDDKQIKHAIHQFHQASGHAYR